MKTFFQTLEGEILDLSQLDGDEKKAVKKLSLSFESNPTWTVFSHFYPKVVMEVYEKRGWARKQMTASVVWKLAQDLSGRLAVEQGYAQLGDYRDELASLIRDKYKTQRAFCKATGLAEDMLSHVLSGRKHLSIESLIGALQKIGYSLHIKCDADFGLRPQSRKPSRGKTG